MIRVLEESFQSFTLGDITWQTVPQVRCCRTESSVTNKACSQHFQLQWTHWPQPLSAGDVGSTLKVISEVLRYKAM